MSIKMRFSSSSLAFSWLKRSSHSACHWVKASEIVETLRSNGCFLKSQEVSKESQSYAESRIHSLHISIALSGTSTNGRLFNPPISVSYTHLSLLIRLALHDMDHDRFHLPIPGGTLFHIPVSYTHLDVYKRQYLIFP